MSQGKRGSPGKASLSPSGARGVLVGKIELYVLLCYPGDLSSWGISPTECSVGDYLEERWSSLTLHKEVTLIWEQ